MSKNANLLLRRINPYIKQFDVSMSDGLQSIPKKYTLSEKKTILHNIIDTYKPNSLEIGSIISPRIVPQMKHSYELYKYANDIYNKDNKDNNNSNHSRSTIHPTSLIYSRQIAIGLPL